MTAISSDNASNWIREFHPADRTSPRMICFPHAGGAASYYFPVSRALAGKIEVLAIQYPGRQDRYTEPAIGNVEALAAAVFRELPTEDLDRTWLFGHSMGAAVAFEVARLMERELNQSPVGIILSGRRAPSRFRPETLHLQGDAAIIANVQSLSGTDAILFDDPDTQRLIMPALRADYRAIETYRPTGTPRVACPIYTFVGDADPLATLDEVGSWRDHTTAEFTLRVFPGDHFYLTARALDVIAAISQLIVEPTQTA
ncbi:thioesterase [Streptomyces sp. 4R-3d]|nr:thioesterase [Streptomyces sp. 4R-3d]